MTVKDIYDFIDLFAPFASQCEWDNCGLAVGSGGDKVSKIACALDITVETVENARKAGADLIVSHHPVIFRPIGSLGGSSPVYLLAKYGIAAICAHTSLDGAPGGVNDALAAALGFTKTERFCTEGEEKMMRFVRQEKPMSSDELASLVSQALSAAVRYNRVSRPISKIAVCGGAGGEFLPFAKENGCDALITGEAKYHEMLAADDLGVTLITAGHFETEFPVVPALARMLEKKFAAEVIVLDETPARIITN